VTSILSMVVTTRSSPTAVGGQQYAMYAVFGLVGVIFVPKFPAGLSLYWITSNCWTLLQSYVATKLIPPPPSVLETAEAPAKPPPPPPRKKKRRR
jgi:membrane protein insertase Oxa1/YidC/SpoIIIJ